MITKEFLETLYLNVNGSLTLPQDTAKQILQLASVGLRAEEMSDIVRADPGWKNLSHESQRAIHWAGVWGVVAKESCREVSSEPPPAKL